MRYHQYYPVDIVNDPGTCYTLFVSGCVHERPGCYNKSTWRLNPGQPFIKEMEDKITADLDDTRIPHQGISLSGGDPLHPQDVPDILQLVQRIHAERPGKDIWVWTDYKLDESNAAQMRVADLINVLVDGKFAQDLKDSSLVWRDSSNQVVHHLRQLSGGKYSVIRLSKTAYTLHCNRFELSEIVTRAGSHHRAFAEEGDEDIVDSHRPFVLILADGEQEDHVGRFITPGDTLWGEDGVGHRFPCQQTKGAWQGNVVTQYDADDGLTFNHRTKKLHIDKIFILQLAA